jgi:hypothetical protein
MRNTENSRAGAFDKGISQTVRSNGSVRDRMREWELERARLREMESVGESDTQDDEQENERPRPRPVRKPSRLRETTSPVPPSPGMVFPFIPTLFRSDAYPYRCAFFPDKTN